jgi:4-carboxymuconolactone decarboxylase
MAPAGVTRDEITEMITHLAFDSAWPTASTALAIAREVFATTTSKGARHENA